MIVDLTGLFDNEGGTLAIEGKLDLGDVKRWGEPLFEGPVSIKGQAWNRSGIVCVSYQADFVLGVVCDRCLTPLTRHEPMKFLHTVVLSLNREDNGEFIVVPDGKLDLAQLASSDILLEIPAAMVCDAQCKGLCPVCGKNLNLDTCSCDGSQPDPRLQKLRDLLRET